MITPLDWAVLVGYLAVITGIGLIAGYRVRRSAEYFLGGRRFPRCFCRSGGAGS